MSEDHAYRTVAVDDLPDVPSPSRHKKEVDEAVGATAFGFNVYAADPGERIPWGSHRHPEHEEVFYVLAGELRIETADGEVRLGADEAFFVPANAPVKATAVGDETTRVIAVGAPKDADHAVIEERCPDCGDVTGRTHEVVESTDGDRIVLQCDACGAETDSFGAGPED